MAYRPSVSAKILRDLSRTRLREAQVLYENEQYSGSYYLAGYSAECAFKAVIAKKFYARQIPDPKWVQDIYIHDLDKLRKLAGLPDLSTLTLKAMWAVVSKWTESSRYEIKSKFEAEEILQALKNGILQWIK